MTREFVVGIPTLNRYDLLRKCLEHVFAGTCKPEMVYIVDNGGGMGTVGSVPSAKVQVIEPQQNLGVSASWNVLLRLARPRPMVLMNDDIFVGPKTLEVMLEPDEACIVTALGWACFRQDAETFKIIGDYDENCHPAYYEDNDYDRRRDLAGVTRVIKENDTAVGHGDDLGKPHYPSSTLRKMTAEQTRELREQHAKITRYYLAKWGGLPGREVFDKPFGGLTGEALEVVRKQWRLPDEHGVPWTM